MCLQFGEDTLDGWFAGMENRVERIAFADGLQWDAQTIASRVAATGSLTAGPSNRCLSQKNVGKASFMTAECSPPLRGGKTPELS